MTARPCPSSAKGPARASRAVDLARARHSGVDPVLVPRDDGDGKRGYHHAPPPRRSFATLRTRFRLRRVRGTMGRPSNHRRDGCGGHAGSDPPGVFLRASGVDAVEPGRGSPEDGGPGRLVEVGGEVLRRLPPGAVGRPVLADRPVRAPHHPFRAEGGEHVVGKGAEITHRPVLVRFRHQPRELAEGRGLVGQPRHLLRPIVEGGGRFRPVVPDARLHAVVDHDPKVRIALEDGEEVVEVRRKAQRVEGEVDVDDGLVGPLHVAPQHPVDVRDVLDQWPHTGELRVAGQPLELAAVPGVLEVHPSDDRQGRVARVREPQHVLGLVDALRGLDDDGPVDSALLEARFEVGRPVAAVQDRVVLGHPVVVAAPGLPIVLVRIDPHVVVSMLHAVGVREARPDAIRSGRRGASVPRP